MKPWPHVRDFAPGISPDTAEWVERNTEHGAARCRDIPRHFAAAAPTHPSVIQWVHTLVRNSVLQQPIPRVLHGPGLLLSGNIGAGKTYEAYGALRAVSASGAHVPWLFTKDTALYGSLRDFDRINVEAHIERYACAPLLVIDDLGVEKRSTWVDQVNQRIIDHRYEHEYPTLITTNVHPSSLEDAFGERVFSRLAEMCCDIVTLDQPDRRRLQTQ